MTSIPMLNLFAVVLILVDDCYKSEMIKLLCGKAGAKPEFTDSVRKPKLSALVDLEPAMILIHSFRPASKTCYGKPAKSD